MKRILTALISAFVLCGGAMADPAGDPPLAASVSPGGIESPSWLADPCPTFSWGQVPGASGYELAVFLAFDEAAATYDAQYAQGEPVLTTRIAAPALSWTPAGTACLDEGGSYLWFVRAETDAGIGEWSHGRRFEIDLETGNLAQAVRRELTRQLSRPETWREVIQEAVQAEPQLVSRLPAAPPSRTIDGDRDTTAAAQDSMVSEKTAWGPTPRAMTFPNPAAFRISSANGVVFDNAAGTGNIPAEGDGIRFMWYPGKGALRAGVVSGGRWDDSNVGLYSTAMGVETQASGYASTARGRDTNASGTYSTALGANTIASGDYSTAMGVNTMASVDNSTAMGWATVASGNTSTAMGVETAASGEASTAMGYDTAASGTYSTAMGRDTRASGNISTAIGYNTQASGDYSTAMGRETMASGSYSTAMGYNTTASGDYSMAMGVNAMASGNFSRAMGYNVVASGGDSTAMGDGTQAHSYGETAIGLYNTGYVPDNTTLWDPDDRLFVIGKGIYGARSDAMVIWKNGHTKLYGRLSLGDWAGATNDVVCRNGDTLALCSSSARYKEEFGKLPLGLETVERLNPVIFKWKGREEYDLGFLAEEVAEIDPLLATYNEEGEIEGVKYRQLTAVLVNAIKEQQVQMEEQQEQIASLKAIVCADHPDAAVCL